MRIFLHLNIGMWSLHGAMIYSIETIPQPIKVGNKLRWWRFMISDRFGIGFLLALAENDESIFDEVPDEQWA